MKNRLLPFANNVSAYEVPYKLNPSVQKDLQYVLNSLHEIALLKKEYNHNDRSAFTID